MSKHNHTYDPHAERMGKGKVGIVGESHIWDGPLSQVGRLHGEGSSSGMMGMKLKLGGVPFVGGPITQNAKEYK